MQYVTGKKNLVVSCGIAFLLMLFQVHSVAAAVTITPLKMEQGDYLVASIPQFDNGLEGKILSEFNNQYRQVVLSAFNQFELTAFEMRSSPRIPDHMKNALTFHAGFEVFRNDRHFISLAQKIYQYTGGAHGMNWITASTVNLETGRAYQLSELFLEGANFIERLSEVVRQEGAIRKLPLWNFKEIRPDSAFYLTDEGVVLFFQPYEIAPYSEGIVRFLIPYRDITDILKPDAGK